MRNILGILTIVFLLLFATIVIAKPTTKSAILKVDLTRSNGTSYNTKVSNTIGCGLADSYYYFYMDTTNWISGSVNDDNFKARLECDALISLGECKADTFEVNVFYTQEAVLTYEDPTPSADSYITGYEFINVSSNLVLSLCYLTHNNTGELVNRTGLLYADGMGCTFDLYDLVNGTDVEIMAYGYGAVWSNSSKRVLKVNSSIPEFTLHHPITDSDHDTFNITFNWTYQDYDDDYSMQKIYIDRGDGNIPNLVYRSFDKNGTYNYTFMGNLSYINTSDPFLYGYWKMDADENYGSLLYNDYPPLVSREHYPLEGDYSGNNRHATYDNGYTTSYANYTNNGFISGAYNFNGNGDFLIIENETQGGQLYQDTGFAVSIWFNTREEINIGTDMLVSKYTPVDFERYWFLALSTSFSQNASNRPAFQVYATGDTTYGEYCNAYYPVVADTSYIKKDTWNHMVGVYDRIENQTHVYANGDLLVTSNCSTTFNNYMNDTAWQERIDNDDGYRTLIGRSGSTNHFNGLIDEVAIWNRSLNTSEVLSLYNATYGEYFYNVTATDWDVHSSGNFSITAPILDIDCIFDCTIDTITLDLDCLGEDFIVNNAGTLTVAYDVINVDKITGSGCRIAILDGKSLISD